jgi:hypothetical protein
MWRAAQMVRLRTVGVMRAQVRPPHDLRRAIIVSRRHAVIRAALASWFRSLMGGERIALSGVETEQCDLYLTSMFRPAGQLSLMQASGL